MYLLVICEVFIKRIIFNVTSYYQCIHSNFTAYILLSLINVYFSGNRLLSTMNSQYRAGAKRIVWVDLEMSGLNIETDKILEIACLVTDKQLNIIATGPNLIIHQPEDVLDNMNEWCTNQHGEVLGFVPFSCSF